MSTVAPFPFLMTAIFLNSYGDRSPKSTLGRVFCILWIITGLIIISIFIAMVTASLSATTHPHFPIHGSLVSEELFTNISIHLFDIFIQCPQLQLGSDSMSYTFQTDSSYLFVTNKYYCVCSSLLACDLAVKALDLNI